MLMIERCCHTHRQRIRKLFITACIDATRNGQCIVDQDIDMAAVVKHMLSKSFKHRFIRDITNKMLSLSLINHKNRRTTVSEFLCNAPSNPVRAPGDHHNLIPEHPIPPLSLLRFFI